MSSSILGADYDRICQSPGDPYRILDVPLDASTDEIKSAYRRLVRMPQIASRS